MTWIHNQLSSLFRTDLYSVSALDMQGSIQIPHWKWGWAVPLEIETSVDDEIKSKAIKNELELRDERSSNTRLIPESLPNCITSFPGPHVAAGWPKCNAIVTKTKTQGSVPQREPPVHPFRTSTMSASLIHRTRPASRRVLASRRCYATELPRPPPPSRQPVIETFSETSKPRPYYAKHPPFRDLPREKVRTSRTDESMYAVT